MDGWAKCAVDLQIVGLESVNSPSFIRPRSPCLPKTSSHPIPMSHHITPIPLPIHMQFWPNTLDRKRVKNYIEHLRSNGPSWLTNIASLDVNLLKYAYKIEVFDRIWSLIRRAWEAEGEGHLAEHVATQYTESSKWKLLFNNCFGIANFIPNQQALERHFEKVKGTKASAGLINLDASYDDLVRVEIPKFIATVSEEYGGQYRRVLPMLDWEYEMFLLHDEKVVVKASHLTLSDCSHKIGDELHGPIYVNKYSNRGTRITPERLSVFIDSFNGKYIATGASPRADLVEYADRLTQFCVLTAHPDPYNASVGRAKRYWRGTCPQHQEYGYCCHSVFWAYQDRVAEFEPSGVGKQRVPKKTCARGGTGASSRGKRKAPAQPHPVPTAPPTRQRTTAVGPNRVPAGVNAETASEGGTNESGLGVLTAGHVGSTHSNGRGDTMPLPEGMLVKYYVRGNDVIVIPTLMNSPSMYLSQPYQYRPLSHSEQNMFINKGGMSGLIGALDELQDSTATTAAVAHATAHATVAMAHGNAGATKTRGMDALSTGGGAV